MQSLRPLLSATAGRLFAGLVLALACAVSLPAAEAVRKTFNVPAGPAEVALIPFLFQIYQNGWRTMPIRRDFGACPTGDPRRD